MSVLRKGWILFAEYCRKHDIKRDGNESRKLQRELDPKYMENLTPLGENRIWAVKESECDKDNEEHYE